MNLVQLLVWTALLLVPQFSDATIPLPALTALIPAGLIAVPTGQLLLGLGLIGVKISLASRLLGYLTGWYNKRSSGRGLTVKNEFVHIPTKSVKTPVFPEPPAPQPAPLPLAPETMWLPQAPLAPQARHQTLFNTPYVYTMPLQTYPVFQQQAFPPPNFGISRSFSHAPNSFDLNVHKSVSPAQPPVQFLPPAPMSFSVSKAISHSPTQTDFSFRKSVANAPSNVDINFSKSISHVPNPVNFYSQPAVAHHRVQPQVGPSYAPATAVPAFPAESATAKPSVLQSVTGGTFDQLLRLAKSPAVSSLISNNPDLVIRILQSFAGPGARMDMTAAGNIEALLNFVRRDPALVRRIIKADPEFVPTILNRILGDTVATLDNPPPPPPPVEHGNGDANGTSDGEEAKVPANVPVDADGQQAQHPAAPYYPQSTASVHPNFGLHVQQGGYGFPKNPPSSSSAYYHPSTEDSNGTPPLVLTAEDVAQMNQKTAAELSSEVEAGFEASKAEKDSRTEERPAVPGASSETRAPITQSSVPAASARPVYVPVKGHYRFDPIPSPSTLHSAGAAVTDVPTPEPRTGVDNGTSASADKNSASRKAKSVPLLATIRRRRRSTAEEQEPEDGPKVDNVTKEEVAEHLMRGYFAAVRTLDSRKCIFKMVCYIGANDKPFGRYGASLASFFGGFSSMLKIDEITSGYSRAFETGRTHGEEGCRIKYNTCPMRVVNLISLATNFS